MIEDENNSSRDKSDAKNIKYPQLTLLEVLRTKDIYILPFIFSFYTVSINVFHSQYKVRKLNSADNFLFLRAYYLIQTFIKSQDRTVIFYKFFLFFPDVLLFNILIPILTIF